MNYFKWKEEPLKIVINSRFSYMIFKVDKKIYGLKTERRNIVSLFEPLINKFGKIELLDIVNEGHPKYKLYKKKMKEGKIKVL